MSTTRQTLAVLAIGAVALTVTACSSSSKSGDPSGSGKGDIRLMVDATDSPVAALGGLSFPYSGQGAKAAAAALNKTGGINGRRIRIDVCDNKGDPNKSAACGRLAKSQGDIAVVGSFDILGTSQILPILQSEKIPYIGSLANSAIELQNPVSFVFDPAAVIANYATVKLWQDSGCKSVAQYALSDNPATPDLVKALKTMAGKAGIDLTVVDIKTGQPDVTAQVSTAMAAKPDCATYEGDGQTNVKIISGMKKAGFTGTFVTAIGSLLPPFLAALGPAGDGVKVVNTALNVDSTDPMVSKYRSDMSTYLGGKNLQMSLNEFSQVAWSSVQLVKLALEGSSDVSSAALLKKLPTMCDVNVGNVYPKVNFCKPAGNSKLFPRLFNTHVRYYVAKGGRYVPVDDQWHDVSEYIP